MEFICRWSGSVMVLQRWKSASFFKSVKLFCPIVWPVSGHVFFPKKHALFEILNDHTTYRQLIATCGNEYRIKIWNIPVDLMGDKTKSGKSRITFKMRLECATFERSLLQSVTFTNQFATIVAASCVDGTVRLFSTKTGLVMLTVNCPGVTRIAVSNNYEYLAIATNSGRCSVYTLHQEEKTKDP